MWVATGEAVYGNHGKQLILTQLLNYYTLLLRQLLNILAFLAFVCGRSVWVCEK